MDGSKLQNTMNYRENSFTLFRYIGAIQVLLNHSDHMNIVIPGWLGVSFYLFQGVPLFFGLSGFLIWRSLDQKEGLSKYVKKRFMRLYPELWMAVFLSIVSIVILYGNYINWIMLGVFAIGQASIIQFWTPSFLDGFGVGTPNGSLWTIPIFIQFYIIIFSMYKYLKVKSFTAWITILCVSLVLNISFPIVGGYCPA